MDQNYLICTFEWNGGAFCVVKSCSLRGEGRRGWEGRLKNGVRMKHMITLD